jgi:hypothetical protein
LEVDDGSSRLEVEVGCSRILLEDVIDSSTTLEVKADMGGDSSSILEVEADIEADITSSRGRCCCITGGVDSGRGWSRVKAGEASSLLLVKLFNNSCLEIARP